MPPPRHQKRQQDFTRINRRIRVPTVRCVDAQGEMLGVMKTSEALAIAQREKLDLVEVSPNAQPPVCRIMDYGKYRYDESRKNKANKKQRSQGQVKEVKFHVNVEQHDYDTKLGRITKFLDKGHKVKVSLMFRGRENAHRELGFEVINKVIGECTEEAQLDQAPRLIGRNIVAMLSPRSAK